MKTKTVTMLTTLVAVLSAGVPARADIINDVDVTLHFTATNETQGFVEGQDYTMTFTVNGDYTTSNSGDYETSSTMAYTSETTDEWPIVSSLSGSALTGTYEYPDDDYWAPYDFIHIP